MAFFLVVASAPLLQARVCLACWATAPAVHGGQTPPSRVRLYEEVHYRTRIWGDIDYRVVLKAQVNADSDNPRLLRGSATKR